MIIAVDFDGTCVKHRYPMVGEDVDGAVSVLKELVRKGHKIILYTMIGNRLQKEKEKKMTESGYYPPGADTKDAPWNQVDNPEREIEVTVSVTLSKTVKIKVSDYSITDSGKDEDGEYFEDIDYSKCDLKRAVEEQITLPQDAYKYVKGEFDNDQYNDLKGWCVDDFEVIEE